LDLALAHYLEQKLTRGGKLDPRPFDVLVRLCRHVKELLLGENAPESYTLNLPGSGSRLIGGAQQVEVTRDEVRQVLLEGFFPTVPLQTEPQRRRSGFQEFGLPYAADAGVTRYLAAFLNAHRHAGDAADAAPVAHDPARPDILLFNGGLFESPEIKQRMIATLEQWFGTTNEPWSPTVLDNERLDLAVARGAAYYGMVRRGEGVRIAAGLARTYYIGVESEPPAAICLVPGNAEPGQDIDLSSRTFDLLVSQPVEFPLYVSSTRLADQPGELLPYDREQMTPLPPIRTALRSRRQQESPTAKVQLHARLTEIGTLDLWCSEVAGERSWRLQFDVRSATQTDLAAHESAAESEGFIDETSWNAIAAILASVFGPAASESPDGLLKRLTTTIELERHLWPTSLLRRMAEWLIEHEAGRRRSVVHEARWLNLLGYCLRPGYGLAVDDWRVNETWRVIQGKLAHGAANIRAESLILWRRIAGGLSPGQQRAVAEPLLAPVRALHRRLTSQSARGDLTLSPQESNEAWRLLGSLELLPATLKLEMGQLMADLLPKKKLEPVRPALAWALGRIGQRVPVYGPLNTVVPAEQATQWLDVLRQLPGNDAQLLLAVMQLARATGDRYRDLDERVRRETSEWLQGRDAPAHLVQLVTIGGALDVEEQGRVFGEALPKGLRIS
ncbi:MAG TPA: molecular chaperone DnaK, partial [Pirellulaceae bacterium]|nr:molecular chaperone DnaK [Pirellulaceae bacterium]